MIHEKDVLDIIKKSARKISDDEWCDSCSWLYQMIENDVEELSENVLEK